ncbi:MAG: sulfoxide reductase heme-binding subunit YedZ [Rhodoferax sp.]|nr:sulfoxide reductase heme-binding subunit YedZ [Rhodoferax sp.]
MPRAAVHRWLLGPWAKPVVFVLALLPLVWLVYAAVYDHLGANPAEALVRSTGDWSLRSLCCVLLVTPLRVIADVPALARLRRMLGLFVYFYVSLHFLAYGWLDMGLDLGDITKDIAKRPFILVGFTALVLLTPLALTSWNGAIRALGSVRWRNLHRLVYAIAVLAVLHFFWMRAGKRDFAEVAVYAVILVGLLGWRVWRRFSRPRIRSRTDL